MHNGFIGTAKEMFPNCTICIDPFHVVKHLNEDAVDAIRTRLQDAPGISLAERRILKGSMRLLRVKDSNFSRIYGSYEAKAREKLNSVLNAYPELNEAYNAVQEFHLIADNDSYAQQRVMLTKWLDQYCSSEVPEIIKISNMIRHWRGYLQNSWKYNRSNGIAEGFNNKVKVLKRISYGLHDFSAFRKRILLTCGYTHLSHSKKSLFAEKLTRKGGVEL
jgi:transposase